jgi:hypothetical protein
MIEQIDRFREMIISGTKGGVFRLPTATGRIVQLNFTRDPTTKRYILQCYDGNNLIWVSNSGLSKDLVHDFNEIIYQYTEL